MISEDQRIMPSGEVGRSVVGRTDPDLQGTGGLELQYNDVLNGVDGEQSREHDRKFRSIAGGNDDRGSDRRLRHRADDRPLAAVPGRAGVAATGASAPSVRRHRNRLWTPRRVTSTPTPTSVAAPQVNAEVTSANLAAVEPHEPGSVAKVFSIAAAVNEGLTTPDRTITVPGSLTFNKDDKRWEKKINDAEPHGPKPMSLRDIIVHSSNIGTILMTEDLGTLRFGRYLHAFGFGSTTGLGLPGESSGIMKPAAEWEATEKVTPRYGYGYLATSLQLVAAVNTIANGGVYVAPRLVLATIDADGVSRAARRHRLARWSLPTTAATMTAMMT